MIQRASFILAVLVGISALPAFASEAGSLLPRMSGTVELVVPEVDAKAAAISDKITQAWAKHGKVLDAHSERHAGQGLVWHEKMGVSRDDLAFMLEKFRSPRLVKVQDSKVEVEKSGTTLRIRLNPYGDAAPNMTRILVFDQKTGSLALDKTRFSKPRFNEGRKPLEKAGRYVPGYEWSLTPEPAATGFVHVGRIPNEPGKCLLNLSVMTDITKPAFGSYRYNCP